jgi:signal transduction histidine kinase
MSGAAHQGQNKNKPMPREKMTDAQLAARQAGPVALDQQILTHSLAGVTETSQIHQLIERVGMINRIHSALRSTLNLEDIHSIILTTLVSRSALDFSRAFLLGYDEGREVYRGLAALGASNREANERIQHEIVEEEQALANMVKDLRALEPTAEERTFFTESLRELSSHSFWITTYQKFSANSALLEAFKGVELPCPAHVAGISGGPVIANERKAGRFLEQVINSESSRIVTHAELAESDLPTDLLVLMPQETVWGVIKTQRGTRHIVIADKGFHDEPLSQTDLLHLDWFIGQVSLALENAEMFHALETAYRDLKDLDRMKSNFLATISHELRTPLTAITGYVQLMLGNKVGGISSGQKEVLERILAHSELLTGKVNDLIEIAELDSGRALDVELDVIDPLNVLMSVLPRVEQRRSNKGITIEPIVTTAIPCIRCSADALGRIMFHLIDNALKFGRTHGHVHINFETNNGELFITVEDDGIGISKGQLQRIFDAFYQVDNQLTRHYDGLGIGLAIIKKQLELTGGRIQVQSEPGHGSSFSIIYPLVQAS